MLGSSHVPTNARTTQYFHIICACSSSSLFPRDWEQWRFACRLPGRFSHQGPILYHETRHASLCFPSAGPSGVHRHPQYRKKVAIKSLIWRKIISPKVWITVNNYMIALNMQQESWLYEMKSKQSYQNHWRVWILNNASNFTAKFHCSYFAYRYFYIMFLNLNFRITKNKCTTLKLSWGPAPNSNTHIQTTVHAYT